MACAVGCAKICRVYILCDAVNKRSVLLSALMLLAAANSIAMSLGRQRGAALIGRPLDISVQAVLDAQEDIASLCLDADVFYADNKLDKTRVRLTAEKGSPGLQDAVIRIRSASLVDEPVVTIYLRVGCQQKTERRYVTLADLASDAAPDRSVTGAITPPLQVSPPIVSLPAAALPTANLSTSNSARKSRRNIRSVDSVSTAVPAEVSGSDTLASSKKTAGKRQERTAAALTTGKPSPTNRPRLKLEPIDLTIDRDPQLKSSAKLLSVPASSPQERLAAAALWRAIAAQPQDIMKDAEKLQSLESSVRSLQSQSQKTQQSINELGVKLQQAESERYANALVYALAFLLLMALAGLAYFMRRRFAGGDTPWWRKDEGQEHLRRAWLDSSPGRDIADSDQQAESEKRKPAVAVKAGLAVPDLDLNFSSSDLSPVKRTSNFDSDSMAPLVSRYRPDFALSISHASRAVKAEELFDVQQQADFFVSIGQHEQAIEVLQNHIGDDVETSALVYLDLFNLYHQLARKDDYTALREDFNRRFNTKIPVFEMYTDAGPGLEAYQMAMSRIEALWPSPKVLEIIEESIFRRPETNAEAFNLEAYRELLMLYSVAKEIITPEPKAVAKVDKSPKPNKFDLPQTPADSVDSQPMGFMSTSIQPLSASIDKLHAVHSGALTGPLLMFTVPPASLNLGLDLDLSEPMPARDNPLPVDVSDAQFFAQFDEDANAELPALQTAPRGTNKLAEAADNLINFDAFDTALGANEKFKLPKV